MPNTVRQAIIALWVTIALGAVIAVIDKRMGTVSEGMFCGFLFIYGASCIFPYKLSRRSNPTRYVFAILTVIGYGVKLVVSSQFLGDDPSILLKNDETADKIEEPPFLEYPFYQGFQLGGRKGGDLVAV